MVISTFSIPADDNIKQDLSDSQLFTNINGTFEDLFDRISKVKEEYNFEKESSSSQKSIKS